VVGFLVISDDLTGANGVAGMMAKHCRTIVVDYSKLSAIGGFNADCIVVNTRSRMVNSSDAEARVRAVVDYASSRGLRIGKRIDSALRGNLVGELRPLLNRVLVVTDTIPEYGRYTENGYTVMGGAKVNILERINHRARVMNLSEFINNARELNGVVVVDSRSHDDLTLIAQVVNKYGYVPVDPGPLNAKVSELTVGASPVRHRACANSVLFIVGSTHENTIRQVERAREAGIRVINLNDVKNTQWGGGDLIIKFDLLRDIEMVNEYLVKLALDFDAVMLSGGETANLILSIADASYIEAVGDVAPLIGIGIVRGGLLDGKVIVTKGGLIGDDEAYLRIRNYLRGQCF